jgi:hypothetical protein
MTSRADRGVSRKVVQTRKKRRRKNAGKKLPGSQAPQIKRPESTSALKRRGEII